MGIKQDELQMKILSKKYQEPQEPLSVDEQEEELKKPEELKPKKSIISRVQPLRSKYRTPSQSPFPVFVLAQPCFVSDDIENNIWMKSAKGKDAEPINVEKFMAEWYEFYKLISADALCYLLPPAEDLQDLVYVNSFCYLPHITNSDIIILSNFTAEGRAGEEKVAQGLLEPMGYECIAPPNKFEGFPELKWLRNNIYFGGYGQRTEKEFHEWLQREYECRVIKIELKDEFCYDEQTEILTDEGWKFFKDLDKTELVATVNEKEELVYQKPSKYQKIEYTGEMYSIKSKHVDLLVTPEHNLYCKPANATGKAIFKNAGRIFSEGKRVIFTHGVTNYPTTKPKKFLKIIIPPISNPTPIDIRYGYDKPMVIDYHDWIMFMGWWISEGHVSRNTTIGITQKVNTFYKKEIFELLSRMLVKFKYYGSSGSYLFGHKPLCNYLKRFGKSGDKFIPYEIKTLPKKDLQLFFETLMKGDSYIRKTNPKHPNWKNSGYTYYSKSKRLADDVQEISIKLGYRASVSYITRTETGNSYYAVYINNRIRHSNILKENIEIVDIKEPIYVYDVTVPKYHTIIVRRNGKSCINSNCYHLDCNLFVLDNENVIACNETIDKATLKEIEKEANVFPVTDDDVYEDACNIIRVNELLIVASSIQRMKRSDPIYEKQKHKNDRLEFICNKMGLEMTLISLDEQAKSGAATSCLATPLTPRTY